jgi:hypothetical protein
LADYHPDHRYTAQLVQDAAYMVTVPAICPDVRNLDANPVILYFSDTFQKPYPFQADIVVDIGADLDKLTTMLDCHISQFYEWLPYNGGHADEVPRELPVRKNWLCERFKQRIRPLSDRYREQVVRTYGNELGSRVEYIEAFEISEYGAALDDAGRNKLFPFLPAREPTASRRRQNWADMPKEG